MRSDSKPGITIRIVVAVLLVVGLLLVCSVRFDRAESGLLGSMTSGGKESSKNLGDAVFYIAYVDWFRGEESPRALIAPWSYRPLCPAIASVLPFSQMTSLNILNLVALLLSVLFLYLILKYYGFEYWWRIVGCAMFIFSFPTFYYGTIGYIDPVLIFFLILGTYCIITERWAGLIITLVLGIMVKESIVILMPVLMVYLRVNGIALKWVATVIIASCLAIAVTYLLIRMYHPGADEFTWQPNMYNIKINLIRPRTYLSLILSFGIPGFLSLKAFADIRAKEKSGYISRLWPFMAGVITSFMLYIYSFLSAFTDGRIIWTAVPFTIPLAIHATRMILKARKGRSNSVTEIT